MKSENQMYAQTCSKKIYNLTSGVKKTKAAWFMFQNHNFQKHVKRQQKRPEENFRSFWLPKQDSNLRHFG